MVNCFSFFVISLKTHFGGHAAKQALATQHGIVHCIEAHEKSLPHLQATLKEALTQPGTVLIWDQEEGFGWAFAAACYLLGGIEQGLSAAVARVRLVTHKDEVLFLATRYLYTLKQFEQVQTALQTQAVLQALPTERVVLNPTAKMNLPKDMLPLYLPAGIHAEKRHTLPIVKDADYQLSLLYYAAYAHRTYPVPLWHTEFIQYLLQIPQHFRNCNLLKASLRLHIRKANGIQEPPDGCYLIETPFPSLLIRHFGNLYWLCVQENPLEKSGFLYRLDHWQDFIRPYGNTLCFYPLKIGGFEKGLIQQPIAQPVSLPPQQEPLVAQFTEQGWHMSIKGEQPIEGTLTMSAAGTVVTTCGFPRNSIILLDDLSLSETPAEPCIELKGQGYLIDPKKQPVSYITAKGLQVIGEQGAALPLYCERHNTPNLIVCRVDGVHYALRAVVDIRPMESLVLQTVGSRISQLR